MSDSRLFVFLGSLVQAGIIGTCWIPGVMSLSLLAVMLTSQVAGWELSESSLYLGGGSVAVFVTLASGIFIVQKDRK